MDLPYELISFVYSLMVPDICLKAFLLFTTFCLDVMKNYPSKQTPRIIHNCFHEY